LTNTEERTLEVGLGARSYPIHIGRGTVARAGAIVAGEGARRAVVVTNETVASHWLAPLRASLDASGVASDVITIADLPEDPHDSPFDDELEEAGASASLVSDGPDSESTNTSTPLPQTSGDRLTLREYREATERSYIVDTLKALDWNISKASIVLGVERTNLHKKVRAYGIKRGEG